MTPLSFLADAVHHRGFSGALSIVATKSWRRLRDAFADRISPTPPPCSSFSGIMAISGETASGFRRAHPDSFEAIVAAARRHRTHEFHYLGRTAVHGPEIRWQLDPDTGIEWRRAAYWETSLHYAGSPSDAKLVWEINRHQHFVTLAQVYFLAHDQAALDDLKSQWIHWIHDNPPRRTVQWASPLEIGLRLISWTIAYQLVVDALESETRETICRSVYQQSLFLARHCSTDKIVTTNHLIGEAAGLLCAATAFAFPKSRAWGARASRILETELIRQTFADGAGKEASSNYLRFDVELLLIATVAMRKSARQFSPGFCERLASVCRYLSLILTPDHTLPRYGDSDDGCGFLLDPSADRSDVRPLLTLAATLLGEASLRRPGHDSLVAWFVPESMPARPASPGAQQRPTVSIFPASGHAVIRTAEEENETYFFVRAGEFGLGGPGFSSHSHCDLFSPIVYLRGRLILTETGTSGYLGDVDERKYLRSCPAHNATVWEGLNAYVPNPWFGWRRCADGWLKEVKESEEGVVLRCGYRPESGIGFERTLTCRFGSSQLEIADVLPLGATGTETFFHLDSGLEAVVSSDSVLISEGNVPRARLTGSPNGKFRIEEGWLSRHYGSKEPAQIILFGWSPGASRTARWILSPLD